MVLYSKFVMMMMLTTIIMMMKGSRSRRQLHYSVGIGHMVSATNSIQLKSTNKLRCAGISATLREYDLIE